MFKRYSALFGLAAVTIFGSDVLSSDTTIIHAGTLLAKPGNSVQSEQSLFVKDGRIVKIEDGYKSADGAEIIDLKDKFVMPGLFDMHVHIQFVLGPDRVKEQVELSSEDLGMRSVKFANDTLMAGFTTVRDLNAESQQQLYALRDAIEKGWTEGPRIIAGAMTVPTGTHGDIDGMRHEMLDTLSSKLLCDGPFECRKAVRQAVKYGADAIKVTSTGGVLSDTDTGTGLQMEMDELNEIVNTAHALGRRVAAHAHAAKGINAALEAGVDSIEHGTYADDRSVELFKKNGAYLVPTLLAGHTVVQIAKNSDVMSPDIKSKALRVGADLLDNFRRLNEAGVKIAFGTDSGVSRHGINAEEAVLMKNAGMSEMDILVSATVNAADLADLSKDLGTLETGKIADIIAMDVSPLSDISALKNVSFVMKDGKTVKH